MKTVTRKPRTWQLSCAAIAMLFGVLAAPAVGSPREDTGVAAIRVTAPNGRSSILVGTVHVPLDGLRQPDAIALMRKAKILLVEHSDKIGPQPQGISEYMQFWPEAQRRPNHRAPWADALTDAQIAHLQRNVLCSAQTSMSQSDISQAVHAALALNSASLACQIAYAPCSNSAPKSRDILFMDAARAEDVPVDILETNVEAEAKRQAVPWQVYEDQLYYSFTPDGQQVLPQIVAAMNAGDFDAVYRLGSSGIRSAKDAAVFSNAMLRDRTRSWMPQLLKYLRAGDAVVLVGAAHLSGPHGLLALLREDGFSVQAVGLPLVP